MCAGVVCTVFLHYIIIETVGYLQPDHVACVSLVYSVWNNSCLKQHMCTILLIYSFVHFKCDFVTEICYKLYRLVLYDLSGENCKVTVVCMAFFFSSRTVLLTSWDKSFFGQRALWKGWWLSTLIGPWWPPRAWAGGGFLQWCQLIMVWMEAQLNPHRSMCV